MKKASFVFLFAGVILLAAFSIQAQESPSLPNSCQPSTGDILSVVRTSSDFSPSPDKILMTGEIKAGWSEITVPETELPLTLAVATLGGISKTASGEIYIVRHSDGNKEKSVIGVKIGDIKSGLTKDINLQRGDLVFVSKGCAGKTLLPPTKPKYFPGYPLQTVSVKVSQVFGNDLFAKLN